MIYDDKYTDYLEMFNDISVQRNLKTGNDVQDHCLHCTDEDSLSERDRFVMILAVIVYEIEHDILTPELEDELYLYYEDYKNGKLDGILGEDEEERIVKDLTDCYNKVFNIKN